MQCLIAKRQRSRFKPGGPGFNSRQWHGRFQEKIFLLLFLRHVIIQERPVWSSLESEMLGSWLNPSMACIIPIMTSYYNIAHNIAHRMPKPSTLLCTTLIQHRNFKNTGALVSIYYKTPMHRWILGITDWLTNYFFLLNLVTFLPSSMALLGPLWLEQVVQVDSIPL